MSGGIDAARGVMCEYTRHLRREERSVRFEQSSRCRAIQNYRSFDSICLGHSFLRLRLHVIALTGF